MHTRTEIKKNNNIKEPRESHQKGSLNKNINCFCRLQTLTNIKTHLKKRKKKEKEEVVKRKDRT